MKKFTAHELYTAWCGRAPTEGRQPPAFKGLSPVEQSQWEAVRELVTNGQLAPEVVRLTPVGRQLWPDAADQRLLVLGRPTHDTVHVRHSKLGEMCFPASCVTTA